MPGVARCVAHGMVLCRAPRGCMLPSRHRTIVVTAAVAVVITIIITVIIIITFIHITIMNTPTQTALPAVADAGAQTKAHHSLLLHMDVMDAVMPHLDTEHAGKLLKAIYYYGSMAAGCGRDYTAELAEQLDDLAMKLLFGSIKTRIDHDIDKWRKACKTSESRAQAGRRGGRHAAAADANQAEANTEQAEANTEQAEANTEQTKANTKQTKANTKQTKANAKQTEANAKQNEANTVYTDTDTDTDTVTDTVTDTDTASLSVESEREKQSAKADCKEGAHAPHATPSPGREDGATVTAAASPRGVKDDPSMCYDYAELMDMAAARALECDTWGQPFGDESDPQSGYAAFRTWLKDNAAYCYTRLKLPTADEFSRMKAAMGSSEMQRLILALENRGDLRRRYKSLYLTILNWHKLDTGHHGKADTTRR